jgi:tetratricopeptide (TPR) repeat protein
MATPTKQTTDETKGAGARRRPNIRMVQNVMLIWLDSSIDKNNNRCQNTITQLRRVVDDVKTFTDGDHCIQFIHTITNNKACMIISGALAQHIVPHVHNMSQVDSIFIFCGNKKRHEEWVKEWSKIKGVFTEIKPICEALKQASQLCEQNTISISFLATNSDSGSKNLDRLDPTFMYSQILKETLLAIKFKQQHIDAFIEYCRDIFDDTEKEVAHVTQLRREYHNRTPIWWYTYEGFLYTMLNRAIRTTDVDIIIHMGFFIGDLHRDIEKLHKEQFGGHLTSKTFTVYRGQGLSSTDFDQLMSTKGGLLSFNNFLSTSTDRDVSLAFAESNQYNHDSAGILFVMTIDPSKSIIPFASINAVSYFQTEDEVLFSMHTIFRIDKIQSIGENPRLFRVDLTLMGEDDKDLRVLTDHIREETYPDEEEWFRLGLVLQKMGRFDKSQEVYEALLGQTTDEGEKAPIYHQIAYVKDNQGEYKEAIKFYEKTLEIKQKTLPPNHLSFADTYNNIGEVYRKMGDYPKALSYYEKALEIQQQSLPPNHPDLASPYNNIGIAYQNMGDYSQALWSHEKVLEIKQQSLPPNHPDLGMSYNNIGIVYYSMGDYPKALSYYEKALEIQKQSLPPNHPDLASSYNNIGIVYYSMGDYAKALSSHKKAVEIKKQSLPPNHPDLGMSYNNIGIVYYSMGDYAKALSSHAKALEIQQQSLPPYHPNLASSYKSIGRVYETMGEYSKALSSQEKALKIKTKSLPRNHPDIIFSQQSISQVYEIMRQHSEALSLQENSSNLDAFQLGKTLKKDMKIQPGI